MHTAVARIVFTAYHFPEPLYMAFVTVPYDPLPKIVQFLRPEREDSRQPERSRQCVSLHDTH